MKIYTFSSALALCFCALADSTTAQTTSTATGPRMTKPTNLYPPELPKVKVRLGAEVLFEDQEHIKHIRGKRTALITNPTGMDSKFISTIDKLAGSEDWQLTALFAPEHGIRGAETAGESVKSGVDPVTSVPVYSLHGTDENKKPIRKPNMKQLEDVDVLIYDMQDIGNRSYTYVGTMSKCMEAAKERGIPFIVLDRPNPMGDLIDGNILDPEIISLVGWAPVAYLYGMTPGEAARWLNENLKIGCDLHVVPMRGYKREMKWWDTGLPWIPTSTHMQKPETCWFIALTGMLGELHSVNEGVGYPAPFEYIGAPWIDSIDLANELNRRKLPGIYFRPVYYKPYYGTHKDKQCGGVQAIITDMDEMRPVESGMHIIEAIHNLYPQQNILKIDDPTTVGQSRAQMFDKVMGDKTLRAAIASGKTAAEITASWKPAREKFVQEREKYLLYE